MLSQARGKSCKDSAVLSQANEKPYKDGGMLS